MENVVNTGFSCSPEKRMQTCAKTMLTDSAMLLFQEQNHLILSAELPIPFLTAAHECRGKFRLYKACLRRIHSRSFHPIAAGESQ